MAGYEWFVETEPRGNEIVSRLLADHQVADEDQCVGYPDMDGVPHDVWRVKYAVVADLFVAAREFSFRFKVFNRVEGAERIRDVTKLVKNWQKGKPLIVIRKARKELEMLIERKISEALAR